METLELKDVVSFVNEHLLMVFQTDLFQLTNNIKFISKKCSLLVLLGWKLLELAKVNSNSKAGGAVVKHITRMTTELVSMYRFCYAQLDVVPCFESIPSFCKEVRLRLRVVEELCSSNKLQRSIKGGHSDIICIMKDHIVSATTSLSKVEVAASKQMTLLDFLRGIKNSLHRPITNLLNELNELAAMRDSTPSQSLKEYEELCRLELKYEKSRSAGVLQEAAVIRAEVDLLATELSNQIAPVRELVQRKPYDGGKRDASLGCVKRLMSLDDTDLHTALASSQSVREDFALAMLELSSHVDSLSSDIKILENFDLEIFLAYLEDWRERVENVVKLQSTTEFVSKLKDLNISREELKKAIVHYREMSSTRDIVTTRFMALQQKMAITKVEVEKLCLSAIKLNVDIVLPTTIPQGSPSPPSP
jgi:hypothetical protein